MADKMILVVAVGDAGPAQLTMSAVQLAALRPLLKHLKAGLEARAGGAYTPVIDAVTAPLGPDAENTSLQDAIRAYLNQTTPDLILPVASAAAKAAQAVVAGAPLSNRIPIVFTVVSDPVGEGLAVGRKLTGVSRTLVDTAKDCVQKFKQSVPGPLRVHVVHRQGLHQADKAYRKITGGPAISGLTQHRHQISGTDCQSILQIIQFKTRPRCLPTSRRRLSGPVYS